MSADDSRKGFLFMDEIDVPRGGHRGTAYEQYVSELLQEHGLPPLMNLTGLELYAYILNALPRPTR